MENSNSSDPRPPALANRILNLVVPAHLRESITGDLEEEFTTLLKYNKQNATRWYWRQTMQTSLHFFAQYLATESLLKKLVIAVTLVLFPTLVLMISWLSNMDHDTSEHIWQSLLQGQVHTFLFEAEVLSLGTDKLLSDFDLGMYFNTPATLWTLFALAALYIRNKRADFSAHQAAAWCTMLMLLPYLFGLIYIEIIQPQARHVGPPVAFMTLSIVYLILPMAWFILSKSKK
ncbi:permease prefix domain 2-containing transporter [Planctobacterium marinum]|uniref:permease prefix domain 2-containing transporter n=1 Tax=Planctobacterium marinum TaxID=1631968 RepID=UPI001E4AC73C|nr:permease prefix domain 2-containing transporter [Planctobacterium marinum]MCC2606392.1 permease prefix domain 2-containing transporter [Planctobacterium marinum]